MIRGRRVVYRDIVLVISERGWGAMMRRKAILNEEVAVVPVDGPAGTATKLRAVEGGRRWIIKGDSIEDWWVEIDADGRELPGDWEYDRDEGYVV